MSVHGRTARWIAVVLWMAVIFGFSSIPSLRSDFPDLVDLLLRKLAHTLEYAALGWLALRAIGSRSLSAIVGALVLGVVYAATDEYHQSFVAGRSAAASDVLVDGLGVLLGVLWRVRGPRRTT